MSFTLGVTQLHILDVNGVSETILAQLGVGTTSEHRNRHSFCSMKSFLLVVDSQKPVGSLLNSIGGPEVAETGMVHGERGQWYVVVYIGDLRQLM